jgi:pyruvate dehydrogenase E2 component (dihydrolipoamide acetyltransferase)
VGIGEPVVELETDKAIVELPAPRAGVVLHHGAAEGETIDVGRLLAVIGDAGERWEPPEDPTAGPSPDPDDLGPADVDGEYERVPLSATRRAIARNMAKSWKEIPHVTTYGEADAVQILRKRADLAASSRDAVPLEALLIRAVIPVLKEHPSFNATLQGDHLLLHRRFDIGFAIDTKEGLVIAVVRKADALKTYELARKIMDLATAARDRSIDIADMRGATFTISNIGAVGGRYGTPIVPYGTTAVLSIGRADPTPAVRGEKVIVARQFPLSLSYDHRVIDGAQGRRFIAAAAEAIEHYEDD